mgnify:CR=1 FL=1
MPHLNLKFVLSFLVLTVTTFVASSQRYEGEGEYIEAYGASDTYYQNQQAEYYYQGYEQLQGDDRLKVAFTSVVGWIVGGALHSRNLRSKLKRQYQKESKVRYFTSQNTLVCTCR